MLQCFCKDFHIISSSFNDSIAYLMLLCIENILKVQYRQIFKVYDENWLLNTRNRFFHSAKIKDLNIFQSFVKFNVVYPNPDFAPLTFWIDWLIDWYLTPTLICSIQLYCGVNKFYKLISFGKTLYLTRWFRSKSCKCAVLNIRTLMKYMYKFIWYGCKIIYLVLNNIHTLSEWFRQPDTVTVFTRNNMFSPYIRF
jgi:hypothetical protein